MRPSNLARWPVLTLTLMLAIVVLGVSAHLLAIRTTNYWRFAALAVAVSSITILTLPIILIVLSLNSHGTGSLIGEALWLSIMWILWLSTAANATRASRRRFTNGACSFFTIYGSKTCNEFRVVEALSYIIFIMLLLYTIFVFVDAARGSREGGGWGRRQPEGAATRGGPETGQVKAAPGNQGQQQQASTPGYSTNVPHDRQAPTQGKESGVPGFPEPESYRA